MALALQYLHKIRVMHRDIKTQNIFMTSSNILVKLAIYVSNQILNKLSQGGQKVISYCDDL